MFAFVIKICKEVRTNKMNGFEKYFMDGNEETAAVLGKKYINKYSSLNYEGKGFCVLSDKRLYAKGKFYVKQNKYWIPTMEERTINRNEVIETGFVQKESFNALRTEWVFGIYFIVTFLLTFFLQETDVDSRIVDMLGCSSYLALFIAIIAMFVYKSDRPPIFQITYTGGSIAFLAGDFDEDEIKNFQKILSMKDKSTSTVDMRNNSNIPNNSVGDELRKLKDLLDTGAITEDEYEKLKQKIL